MNIKLFIAFSVLITTSFSSCPNGTINGFDSKTCYLFSQFLDTWGEAENYCITKGGHVQGSLQGCVLADFIKQIKT